MTITRALMQERRECVSALERDEKKWDRFYARQPALNVRSRTVTRDRERGEASAPQFLFHGGAFNPLKHKLNAEGL